MKKIVCLTLISLISLTSFAQTQLEMNEEAFTNFQKADKKLNAVYQKILQMYKNEAIFIKNLKTSQRLWVQLRDANVDMTYPEIPGEFSGSIRPLCVSNLMTTLTEERINYLKQWIDGTVEGDMCSGSIRMR